MIIIIILSGFVIASVFCLGHHTGYLSGLYQGRKEILHQDSDL
jgi:hypothetical protein